VVERERDEGRMSALLSHNGIVSIDGEKGPRLGGQGRWSFKELKGKKKRTVPQQPSNVD